MLTKGCQCAHLAGASRTHHYDAEFAHGCVGGFSDLRNTSNHLCNVLRYFRNHGVRAGAVVRAVIQKR